MYIVNISNVTIEDISSVGFKAAMLSVISENYDVPEAFVIKSEAFEDFITAQGLMEPIKKELISMELNDSLSLQEHANNIQKLIMASDAHERLAEELKPAYEAIAAKSKKVNDMVEPKKLGPVRVIASSTEMPTGHFFYSSNAISSFEELVKAVISCYASVFTASAIKNRYKHKIKKTSMAIVVQKMLWPEKTAFCYNYDIESDNKDEILIKACFGFAAQSKEAECDSYIVDKESLAAKKKLVIKQKSCYLKDIDEEKLVKLDISEGKGGMEKLDDEEIRAVSRIAKLLEKKLEFDFELCFSLIKSRPYIVDIEKIPEKRKREDKENIRAEQTKAKSYEEAFSTESKEEIPKDYRDSTDNSIAQEESSLEQGQDSNEEAKQEKAAMQDGYNKNDKDGSRSSYSSEPEENYRNEKNIITQDNKAVTEAWERKEKQEMARTEDMQEDNKEDKENSIKKSTKLMIDIEDEESLYTDSSLPKEDKAYTEEGNFITETAESERELPESITKSRIEKSTEAKEIIKENAQEKENIKEKEPENAETDEKKESLLFSIFKWKKKKSSENETAAEEKEPDKSITETKIEKSTGAEESIKEYAQEKENIKEKEPLEYKKEYKDNTNPTASYEADESIGYRENKEETSQINSENNTEAESKADSPITENSREREEMFIEANTISENTSKKEKKNELKPAPELYLKKAEAGLYDIIASCNLAIVSALKKKYREIYNQGAENKSFIVLVEELKEKVNVPYEFYIKKIHKLALEAIDGIRAPEPKDAELAIKTTQSFLSEF